MTPNNWTAERTNRLKELWATSLSCSQIALEIGGITRCAVIGKVRRLGLPGRLSLNQQIKRFRSGPISYEEKMRRQALRYAKRVVARMERQQRESLPLPVIETPPVFLGLEFAQIESDQCRYPIGDGPFTFCGQPRMNKKPYCKHCYRICYPRQSVGRIERFRVAA